MNSRKTLVFLFFVGLAIRISLLFLDYSWDVNSYITWGKDTFLRGFEGFYATRSSEVFADAYPNYPPFTIYLFFISFALSKLMFQLAWHLNILFPLFPSKIIFFLESKTAVASVFKLPTVFSDLGIGILIFLFAQKLYHGKKISYLAASLVLFNPAFFYNSSLWGQTDAIPLFFVLLSFYLLLFRKKFLEACVLFALSLLSKQTALIFFPVFLIIVFKKFGLTEAVKSLVVIAVLFFLLFLPFYKEGNILLFPYATYLLKIVNSPGLTFINNHAFNFWALVTAWQNIPDTAVFLFGLPYRFFALSLFGIFALWILFLLYRKNISVETVLWAAMLIAYAGFLFLPRMHERHFEQVLPFFLLLGLKEKKLFWMFIFLSLFHTTNLYHNWSVPRIDWLVTIILSPLAVNGLILGVFSIFLFLWFRYIGVFRLR